MGSITSRRQNNAAIEEDVASQHAYKYPPKSGNFFGSHFIMGGERFDTPQPEAYLFGENADLNFLHSRPTAFPYPPPQANEPTKTLKSLVNIRKESVRFVKTSENIIKNGSTTVPAKSNLFHLEFVFDSDANCAITIYYFCSEEISPCGVSYSPKNSSLTSETFHYKKGVNQYFSQPSHIFNPNLFSDDDLIYKPESDVFPVAIHCVVEEGSEDCRQSHTTICVIDHHDGTYVLRALKQKIFVDGLCYLLQEIYGIENKTLNKPAIDDDTDDNGSECVICMSDTRDTLILPCRHLCLCNSCADSLRYQANNCPICRAPFRALLQIRAVKKGVNTSLITAQNPPDPNCEHIPPGYIPVSLIEALNGPPQCIGRALSGDNAEVTETDNVQGADLNKSTDKNGKSSPKSGNQKRSKNKSKDSAPEFRMSIITTNEENSPTEVDSSEKQLSSSSSPQSSNNRRSINSEKQQQTTKDKASHKRQSSRESLKIVNERHSVKLQSPTENDNDSDGEKLSPLLSNQKTPNGNTQVALHIDEIEESIDDTDPEDLQIDETQSQKKKRNRPALADGDGTLLAGAEDSDYYTPEDTHTTILSPLCPEKSSDGDNMTLEKNIIVIPMMTSDNLNEHNINNIISTSVNNLKENATNSLPDSPISGNSASTRSSGDSYSSSASTKQLLSPSQATDSNIKHCDEKQKLTNSINA